MELTIEQSGYNRVTLKCENVQEVMSVINVMLPLIDEDTFFKIRVQEESNESNV